jgi:sugar lactone lactonase YvrE
MRRVLFGVGSIAVVGAVGAASIAFADGDWEEDPGPPTFQLDARSVGGARTAAATPAFLAGGRIAVVGDGAVAIDADSGALIYAARDGTAIAQLAIGTDAGVLAYDPVTGVAYVADRHGDRIVAAAIDDPISVVREWRTAAEPFGVALTPDHKTLLVTAIGERALVAYDVITGEESWRVDVGREPRGVAIAPDGATAVVTHLATGAIERISIADRAVVGIPLTTQSADHVARGAWAAAFLGNDLAVAPHQHALPAAKFPEGGEGRYGGGFSSPITHHLAFVSPGGELPRQAVAEVSVHQPRSLAWDGARDALYIAGLGNDEVVEIRRASQTDPILGTDVLALGGGKQRCGPDGLAVREDGDVVVWCSFTRSVVRLDTVDKRGELRDTVKIARGPTLVASSMDAERQAGMQLFYAQQFEVSNANLACGSCHLDGRTDGLSWLIEKKRLQTPLLAGRIADTAPYKWTGVDASLAASLASTIHRLDGTGLRKDQLAHLATYVAGMPSVRPPPRDTDAVARGQALFASESLGCADCHGGPSYTDRETHPFAGTLASSDTPSLLGLANSAPYYHDGSAATLEVVLRDQGAVHGMSAAAAELSDAQTSDLIAFLESL